MADEKSLPVASVVLKRMSLMDGQIEWKIKDFVATLNAGKLRSRSFKFFFPEANKTVWFKIDFVELRDNLSGLDFVSVSLITRNSGLVQMTAELKVGDMSFPSERIEKGLSLSMYVSPDILLSDLRGDSSGSVNISAKFSVLVDLPKSGRLRGLEPVDSNKKFLRSQKNLLLDQRFTDFTIECGTETFPCHKAILANRSDVFARLFSSEDWVENKKDLLQIGNHEPAIVEQMSVHLHQRDP